MIFYRLTPVWVFLIGLATYLYTLTPTVDFIDSGELAATAATLGITHPTGYPLFTLIAFCFSKLPLAGRVIVRLNIMSSLFAALGAGLFTLLANNFLGAVRPLPRQKKMRRAERFSLPPGNTLKLEWLAAGTAGLVLAGGELFWQTGTTLEVYSLHGLFTIGLLYLAFIYRREETTGKRDTIGRIFFLLLGLSFANHLTTILTLPAYLFLFGESWIREKTSLRRILSLLAPALIGLAFYLYLPLRAASRPVVMWDDPGSIPGFFNNLTVSDFRDRILAHQTAGVTIGGFLLRLPRRMGLVAFPLILAGMVILWKRKRFWLYFLLTALIPNLIYASTYNVPDNLFYFAPFYIYLMILGAVGVGWLFDLISRHGMVIWRGAVLVPLLVLPPFLINYPAVNQRDNYFVEDFIHNLFRAIEPNAILFALDCHIQIHPLYYYQNVENFRSDVVILPNHSLRKGWGAEQLKYHHPEI